MKELKQFDGDLQCFADKVYSEMRTSNEIKILGSIDSVVIEDLKSKGLLLETTDIAITDKVIMKYYEHPKSAKGASIDKKRYNEVEIGINSPTNIYQDIESKSLVYVYSSRYDDKILKLIIKPNYTINGNTVNLLNSIGIVPEYSFLNLAKYKKIK
ncbi:MAG: hypothetical protein LBR67_05220 [Dysgonamonadaceae bacterium]|jgi:hypothetical protein|nr:hypothetical protein [Dysgonamonadaceae bacterium]